MVVFQTHDLAVSLLRVIFVLVLASVADEAHAQYDAEYSFYVVAPSREHVFEARHKKTIKGQKLGPPAKTIRSVYKRYPLELVESTKFEFEIVRTMNWGNAKTLKLFLTDEAKEKLRDMPKLEGEIDEDKELALYSENNKTVLAKNKINDLVNTGIFDINFRTRIEAAVVALDSYLQLTPLSESRKMKLVRSLKSRRFTLPKSLLPPIQWKNGSAHRLSLLQTSCKGNGEHKNDACFNLAERWYRIGNYAKSTKLLKKLCESSFKNSCEYLKVISSSLEKLNSDSQSKQKLCDSSGAASCLGLAKALYGSGGTDKALKVLSSTCDSEHLPSCAEKARVLFYEGQEHKAWLIFEELCSGSNKSPETCRMRDSLIKELDFALYYSLSCGREDKYACDIMNEKLYGRDLSPPDSYFKAACDLGAEVACEIIEKIKASH